MHSIQLTNDEFAVALQHGRGRAMLHVKQFGLMEVADLVLDACIHNQTYDPQCEDSRHDWLLEMFEGSPDYPRFVASIVSALENNPEDVWDVSQMCFLAAILTNRGDHEARRALRCAVLHQAREGDPWIGLHAFISAEGVEGVLDLARCYGMRVLKSSEDEPPLIVDIVESKDLLEKAMELLKSLSNNDNEISAYLEFCETNIPEVEETRKIANKRSRREYRKSVRQELTLKKILADASSAIGKSPNQYMRFGRYATTLELKKVLQRLLTETDDAVILRLLWVFRSVAAPELHPRFFELASNSNKNIRSSALLVLAQFQDSSVGELARHFLLEGYLTESDSEVLNLFIRNYQPSDANLIISALRRLKPTSDDAHWLGMSILRICEENQVPELIEALHWVYDTTPCTTCRRDAVEYLSELGEVTPDIIEECLYDASERTRQLARYIKGI